MSLTSKQLEVFALLAHESAMRNASAGLQIKEARKELRGFTHEFLLAFADAEQREANRLQAEAARRQWAADAARKELKRRKRADNGDQQRT